MAAPLHIVRKPLVNTAAIRADWVHYAGLSRDRTAELHEPEIQVLITLGGAFHYHVGRARWLVDSCRAGGQRPARQPYDLYVSHRAGDAWQAPVHPGAPVNSAAWDFGPRLSPDGQLLFFSSNRGFGSEPLSRPLGFEELEQRLRAPHNGLRDVYVVDPRALGL
jgi:hypothetical protein